MRPVELAPMGSLLGEMMTNKAIAAKMGADANEDECRRCRVVKERMSRIEKACPCGANHDAQDSNKKMVVRSKFLEATTQWMPSAAAHLGVPVDSVPSEYNSQGRQPGGGWPRTEAARNLYHQAHQ